MKGALMLQDPNSTGDYYNIHTILSIKFITASGPNQNIASTIKFTDGSSIIYPGSPQKIMNLFRIQFQE